MLPSLPDSTFAFPHNSRLNGLKIWVHILGCRSNLYEGEALAAELKARGALVVDRPEGCRSAVIVSCSVTAAADRKCRQAVRRARREFGADGIVAVCGCWAQDLAADAARALDIDILVGNRLKNALPDALESALTDKTAFVDIRQDLADDRSWDVLSLNRPVFHTRAFLKVQEGCDHFCSYCVIPFLRGRSTSRPLEEALTEARKIVDSGCREIVLTGIHLGAYGREVTPSLSLAELVRRFSAIPGLTRLRLGSLEPFALDEELLSALADSPVFCPHLHLPLQSGDDEVLARMRRGHTAAEFARICEKARDKLGEDLHISSDILVAFPGESDAAFHNTLSLMKTAGLGRVHVFPFSPRRGTAAANLPDRLPPYLASRRVERAMELGAELLQHYSVRFVGKSLSVLAENVKKSFFSGYTRHFVVASVESSASEIEPGQEIKACIADCIKGELRGKAEITVR